MVTPDPDQERSQESVTVLLLTFPGRAQLLRLQATGVGHGQRERDLWGSTFIAVSVGRTGDAGETSLALASLTNFSRPCGMEADARCLVRGPAWAFGLAVECPGVCEP